MVAEVQSLAQHLARRDAPAAVNAVKQLARVLATGNAITARIRTALIDDLTPVLDALRALITKPDKSSLLTIAANLADIERHTVLSEFSDAAWHEFMLAEFTRGLEAMTESQINADIDFSTRTSRALTLAQSRGILPTHLDTQGIRDLDAAIRARAFFSARTTSAGYVQALKNLVERHITGEGYDNDLPKLRIEARQLLQAFGYTPEQGFPGDAALGIPSAEPGTLRDLASERRLNLIFNTQASLMRGLARKLRGLDRIDQFPAWELIRIAKRTNERDWPKRWDESGGPDRKAVGGRMIASKDGEIWSVLGDSSTFKDALDVDHPPFAFESGMGWRELSWSECNDLGMQISPTSPGDRVNEAAREAAPKPPVADQFIGGQATLDRLAARLAQIQKEQPLSRASILASSS